MSPAPTKLAYFVLFPYFENSAIAQMAIGNNCCHLRSPFLQYYTKALDSLAFEISVIPSFVTIQCVAYISKCIIDLTYFILHCNYSLVLYLSD